MNYVCLICHGNEDIKIDNSISLTDGQQIFVSDLIYICFKISIKSIIGDNLDVTKICNNCITRLCDAYNFKQQIIDSLNMSQSYLKSHSKDNGHLNNTTLVKMEDAADVTDECQKFQDAKEICLKMEPIELTNIYESTEDVHSINTFQGASVSNHDKSDFHYFTNTKDSGHFNDHANDNALDDVIDFNDTNEIYFKMEPIELQNISQSTEDVQIENAVEMQTDNIANQMIIKSEFGSNIHFPVRPEICNTKNIKTPKPTFIEPVKNVSNVNNKPCKLKLKRSLKEKSDTPQKNKPLTQYPGIYKPDKNNKTCEICHKVCFNNKQLMRHMHEHFPKLICDTCDRKFSKMGCFLTHLSIHKLQGSFTCEICNKSLKNRDSLRKHKNIHSGIKTTKFRCQICRETFDYINEKHRHMELVHNKTPVRYKCTFCPNVYNYSNSLATHVRRIHLQERNYTCVECGKSVFSEKLLKQHMLVHDDTRIFECDICHNRFKCKRHIREHMIYLHGQKTFQCTICNKLYSRMCTLNMHMKSHKK